jgi:hypothetical protein
MQKIKKEVFIMPGFDGSGPNGKGPMTGGGRGYCVVPVSAAKEPFSGFRRLGSNFGGGRGGGRRCCFYATGHRGWMRTGVYDGTQENVEMLKSRAAILEDEIRAVTERIKSLESNESK